MRFDRHTLGLHVGVGPQVEGGVGGQQHRLFQRLDVGALLGGDVDEHGVAAEVLGDEAVLGELRTDLGRIGTFLIDLVDRHHDRHIGGLRVVDRLHRLRHHAVVGGDHQDRDVGGLRAAGTHGGERLVARGVDEGDRPRRAVEIDDDLVGTDVLGDAACLFLTDVGLTDGVQQSGLAVVDVTHHGDHRRTTLQIGLVALVLAVGEVEGLQQFAVLVLGADDLHDVVHLAAEQFERLVTHRLGGRDHLAEIEQCLHQRRRVRVDLLGEVGQRRAAGEPDGLAVAVRQPHAADDRRLHVLVLGAFCPLRLTPASWRTAGTAERACGTAALTGTASAATTGTTAIAACCGRTTTAAAAAGSAGAVVTAAASAGTTRASAGRAAWAATAGCGTWATGTCRTAWRAARGTGRHVAWRGAGTRAAAGSRGTGSWCLRPRNRPVHGLRRGERVVSDARCARCGFGTWRRSARPGTGGRCRGCGCRC